MEQLYQPPNPIIMDTMTKKELLHLRIEQANEQMLDALAELAEVLFKTWQPEVVETAEEELNSEEEYAAIYKEHLKPMTHEEMTNELRESMADYEKGNYISLEESAKEAASW
ncbi:MAG: hypothetical protein AAF828_04330 [Bacteroidota bacterium]